MDLFTGLAFQIGASLNEPLNDNAVFNFKDRGGIHLQVEKNDWFLWSGYNYNTTSRLLGQTVSKNDIYSFGVGWQKEISKGIKFTLGAGYGIMDVKPDTNNVAEVSYTYLVSRHNVYNRPIPVNVISPYDQVSYASTWEISNELMYRVGVEFDVSDNVSLSAGYRLFSPTAKIEIYDEEQRASGGGYWTERVEMNMNVFEIKMSYQF